MVALADELDHLEPRPRQVHGHAGTTEDSLSTLDTLIHIYIDMSPSTHHSDSDIFFLYMTVLFKLNLCEYLYNLSMLLFFVWIQDFITKFYIIQ